jgi:hypothetical protein
MDKKTIKLVETISQELNKKKKSLKLEKLSFVAEHDNEIIEIRSKIDECIKNIEVLQRFCSSESKELKEKYQEISELKAKMFKNKKFIKYNNALKKYNEYIDLINDSIFTI